MITNVELLDDAHAQVGEGPIWDDVRQILYWVDITNSRLHEYEPIQRKRKSYDIGQHVGTVVPCRSGAVMLALANGFARFVPASGVLTMLNDPESHLPNNRFNDGKCDPAGRFWAGTMAYSNQSDQGSVYRMDADLSVRKMFGGVGISNGIVWSLDNRTMYYIDSVVNAVRAYDYDLATGNLSNERIAFRTPQALGLPDGMTIDADGMLWIGHWGGSRLCRWHPQTGEILDTIMLPVTQVTACAFGGQDLDTIFITTAALGLSEEKLKEQPLAGALFAVKSSYRGVNAFRFAD